MSVGIIDSQLLNALIFSNTFDLSFNSCVSPSKNKVYRFSQPSANKSEEEFGLNFL